MPEGMRKWLDWLKEAETDQLKEADCIFSHENNTVAIWPVQHGAIVKQCEGGYHIYVGPDGEPVKCQLYTYDPALLSQMPWKKEFICGGVDEAVKKFAGKKLFDGTLRLGLKTPLSATWQLIQKEAALVEKPSSVPASI